MRGAVWVGGSPALPSTALFAGDVVTTGGGSVAVMRLTSGVTAVLGEDSEALLSREREAPRFDLRRGVITLNATGNQPAQVDAAGVSVVAQGQGEFPAQCWIAAHDGSAEVFNRQGLVQVQGAGAPLTVAPGRSVRLASASRLQASGPRGLPAQAGATGQQAGKVTNAIPAETVQPQGKGTEVKLNIADIVNWADVVRTLKTGRVRIQLLDGSLLNIGAGSVMHIVKHDPQSQQTQIEFTLGRLRGEVVKLAKPGANFEIRTQTAVIGVVGTIFVIHALPNLTRVHCIQGALRVQGLAGGQVALRAGMSTTVVQGRPPVAAFRSPPAQLRGDITQTNIGPSAISAPSGITSVVTNPTVTNVVTASTSGTSTGLNAATEAALGATSTTLTTTSVMLTQATTTTNTATATLTSTVVATNATIAAVNNTNATVTQVATAVAALPSVSPFLPPCGCE